MNPARLHALFNAYFRRPQRTIPDYAGAPATATAQNGPDLCDIFL